MANRLDQQDACVRSEPQPFVMWLALDLQQRFGDLDTVPDSWIDLVDGARAEE